MNGWLENRIKAQKFVYFGKKVGLPLGYDFDIYLYGPYSSKLADDYYHISDEEWNSGTLDIPEDIKQTLSSLKRMDALYMEVAATFDSLKSANSGVSDNVLIDAVSTLKHNRLTEKGKDKAYIQKVVKELSKLKLS